MPVLPVTKMRLTGMSSRTRFCMLAEVGAKWRPATVEITCRLSSSGNGVRLMPPVRRPASTWTTGIRRWKAESAAAIAELVSPWTRTAAGRRPLRVSATVGGSSKSTSKRSAQKSSKRRITVATRSLRLERLRAGPEDDIGLDVGQLEDVVDHLVVLAGGDDDRLVVGAARSARMIGTSLIASGRVPTTTGTLSFVNGAPGVSLHRQR